MLLIPNLSLSVLQKEKYWISLEISTFLEKSKPYNVSPSDRRVIAMYCALEGVRNRENDDERIASDEQLILFPF